MTCLLAMCLAKTQIMAVRDEFKHVAHLQCTQLRTAGWMLETLKRQ